MEMQEWKMTTKYQSLHGKTFLDNVLCAPWHIWEEYRQASQPAIEVVPRYIVY